jgi:RNA polymerase sigma-70 factor (ECF subfamily)
MSTADQISSPPATERCPGNATAPLRSGDPRAFDQLYADLAPRVMGYVLRLNGGGRAEAEDIVQETFLAAFTGRSSFTGRSQPLAWLLGIARRRWRDDHRTRRLDTVPLDAEETDGALACPAEQITRSVVLERAMARLPLPEREALVLVAVQGLTYREAADILHEPIGTVKWRVHEATKRMRCLLAGWEETK